MKRALILHGIFGKAGENWGQWLHDQLILQGYDVAMPTLPGPDHPDRAQWLAVIRHYAGSDVQDLTIVAHSLGVASALDYIEQSNTLVNALVSVAGFSDDYGAEINSYFMRSKDVDFDKVNRQLRRAAVLYGDDDPYVPRASLQALADALHVRPVVVRGGGHLNEAAGYGVFPLLLETIGSIAA